MNSSWGSVDVLSLTDLLRQPVLVWRAGILGRVTEQGVVGTEHDWVVGSPGRCMAGENLVGTGSGGREVRGEL